MVKTKRNNKRKKFYITRKISGGTRFREWNQHRWERKAAAWEEKERRKKEEKERRKNVGLGTVGMYDITLSATSFIANELPYINTDTWFHPGKLNSNPWGAPEQMAFCVVLNCLPDDDRSSRAFKKYIKPIIKIEILHALHYISKNNNNRILEHYNKANTKQFFIEYGVFDKLADIFLNFQFNSWYNSFIIPSEKLMFPIQFKSVSVDNDSKEPISDKLQRIDLTKEPYVKYPVGSNFTCLYDYITLKDYLYFTCDQMKYGTKRFFLRVKINSKTNKTDEEVIHYLTNKLHESKLEFCIYTNDNEEPVVGGGPVWKMPDDEDEPIAGSATSATSATSESEFGGDRSLGSDEAKTFNIPGIPEFVPNFNTELLTTTLAVGEFIDIAMFDVNPDKNKPDYAVCKLNAEKQKQFLSITKEFTVNVLKLMQYKDFVEYIMIEVDKIQKKTEKISQVFDKPGEGEDDEEEEMEESWEYQPPSAPPSRMPPASSVDGSESESDVAGVPQPDFILEPPDEAAPPAAAPPMEQVEEEEEGDVDFQLEEDELNTQHGGRPFFTPSMGSRRDIIKHSKEKMFQGLFNRKTSERERLLFIEFVYYSTYGIYHVFSNELKVRESEMQKFFGDYIDDLMDMFEKNFSTIINNLSIYISVAKALAITFKTKLDTAFKSSTIDFTNKHNGIIDQNKESNLNETEAIENEFKKANLFSTDSFFNLKNKKIRDFIFKTYKNIKDLENAMDDAQLENRQYKIASRLDYRFTVEILGKQPTKQGMIESYQVRTALNNIFAGNFGMFRNILNDIDKDIDEFDGVSIRKLHKNLQTRIPKLINLGRDGITFQFDEGLLIMSDKDLIKQQIAYKEEELENLKNKQKIVESLTASPTDTNSHIPNPPLANPTDAALPPAAPPGPDPDAASPVEPAVAGAPAAAPPVPGPDAASPAVAGAPADAPPVPGAAPVASDPLAGSTVASAPVAGSDAAGAPGAPGPNADAPVPNADAPFANPNDNTTPA